MREARGLRRYAVVSAAVAAISWGEGASAAPRPIAGENVNMVSGTRWPGGDPHLQRQNEPSVAVSTANPSHLLAGANDYRTVDLPFPEQADKVVGDAWLGLFKSLDGGRTWASVLLPGYPQDPGCAGAAPSPLCGLSAAADPVVRAGTDGTFFYSGIAFDRGGNVGKVFVSRFLDLNDKENGDPTAPVPTDPIRYAGTVAVDRGTAGQFLDKPWLAVDQPRAGAASCTIAVDTPRGPVTRTVEKAGNVYLAYAMFTGSSESISKILFVRSTDCGATWSLPVKLSETQHVNQGTAVAVDPLTGAVYVVWRRFAGANQGDAIVFVKSVDGGKTFTKPALVRELALPFDQYSSVPAGATATRFRTQTMPTAAVSVDEAGVARVHVAWAERTAPGGPARVVLATSSDGGATWPAPVAVDDRPDVDAADACVLRPSAFQRLGHQVMPSVTFGQGRLLVVYYDTSYDHTRRYFEPAEPFAPVPGCGRYYREKLAKRGELLSDPSRVWGAFVDDAGLTEVRHTVDVRVASAAPAAAPAFTAAPASRYAFGARGDEEAGLRVPGFDAGLLEVVSADGELRLLQDLQVNPPNLPLFKQGTVPFIGDYLDVAGLAFVKQDGAWTANVRPTSAPVFHAVWTTNQDVRAPADGDWRNYTPVGTGGPSRYDPTKTVPACVSGQEGMRNQNVYTARITEGLLVTSPQNAKRLSDRTSAFVVMAQNATAAPMTVRLTASVPAGTTGLAFSFTNDGAEVTTLVAEIAPHSSIHRSVFARLAPERCAAGTTCASEETAISVVVEETSCTAPACRAGAVTLNGAGAPSALVDPDGVTAPIASGETYAVVVEDPNISNPNISNPNISNRPLHNPNISNPNISNPNISNPNISNPNISNSSLAANADLANIGNPNISNPNISNPNISNPNISNPNISNPNISNAPVSDLNYRVKNEGNTTASYHVKIVSTATPPSPLQVVATRTYYTPVAVGCALFEQPNPEVIVNAADVSGDVADPSDPASPNISNSSASNLTIALAPGEEITITLRGAVDLPTMAAFGAKTRPAVVPHAGVPAGTTYGDLAGSWGSGIRLVYDATTRLFTATVFSDAPAGSPAPTGTVQFLVDGEAIVAPLGADLRAQLDASSLALGTPVVAYYPGDHRYRASVSTTVTAGVLSRWTTLPPLAVARAQAGAAAVGGSVFVVGGYDGAGSIASVQRFDVATGTWGAEADLGTSRSGHAVVAAGGRLWALGGVAVPGSYLGTFESLAPGGAWTAEGTLPAGRFDASAAAIETRIYLTGGLEQRPGVPFGGIDVYDTATGLWTASAALGCTARRGHATVAWGGSIYLVGGYNYGPGYPSTALMTPAPVEVYDPVTETCAWVADLDVFGAGAAVVGGKLYVAGGGSVVSGAANYLTIVDPATGDVAPGPASPTSHHYPAVAASDAGVLYVAGGWINGIVQATVEAFTP